MTYYRSNSNCRCARCRCSGLMAPVVLVTLGILFLVDNLGYRSFGSTWPILLIAIGVVLVVRHSASTESHLERGAVVMPPPYGMVPPQPPEPPVPPPPPGEVHHG